MSRLSRSLVLVSLPLAVALAACASGSSSSEDATGDEGAGGDGEGTGGTAGSAGGTGGSAGSTGGKGGSAGATGGSAGKGGSAGSTGGSAGSTGGSAGATGGAAGKGGSAGATGGSAGATGGKGGATGGAAGATGGAAGATAGAGGKAGEAGAAGATNLGGKGGGTGCGDGTKQASEQCDGIDFGTATCATVLSNPNMGGKLKCSGACTIDTAGCSLNPVCGDNVVNAASEECDGSDYKGATCASATGEPMSQGSLSCSSSCKLVTTGCKVGAFCGDAKKDPNESCDGKDAGGATCATVLNNPNMSGQLSCKTDCSFDTAKCTLNPTCGDGTKNQATEQCDGTDLNGGTCQSLLGNTNAIGTPKCTSSCAFDVSGCSIPPYCGDSIKNGNETCDGTDFGGATCASLLGPGHAGNLTCSAQCAVGTGACTVVPICGDNAKNQASELCDGTDLGGATCASVVGSGSTGTLKCFGNCSYDSSGCSAPVLCGNGTVDGGEQCDGNNFGGATCATVLNNAKAIGSLKCSSACTLDSTGCSIPPYCGDGKLNVAGEECDDGNGASNDGCSASCIVECGSGEYKLGTHCYGEYGPKSSWDAAQTLCQSDGGYLVTITSQAELDLVWNQMSGGDTTARWIGYNDKAVEGTFTWVTGETNGGFVPPWDSGEPNNSGNEDCVEFYYWDKTWNDNNCSQSHYFWCEYSPIVLYP